MELDGCSAGPTFLCLPGGSLGPPIYFLGPRTCEDAAGVLVACCGGFSCLLMDIMLR